LGSWAERKRQRPTKGRWVAGNRRPPGGKRGCKRAKKRKTHRDDAKIECAHFESRGDKSTEGSNGGNRIGGPRVQ